MSDDPHLGKVYGNVILKARLGQGAMGAVYRGWNEKSSREVAVKILVNVKGNAKERFLREGKAAAKVRHQNVVQVMDAGESNGVAYLVMELVSGDSLEKLVVEHGPLEATQVMRVGRDVSAGLAAIHAKGIIHRDIKPENILLSSDLQAKITDLGLAKQTDDPDLARLTATGMVVGTPLYVAPESISDPKTATGAADIYSLGATLYFLITGQPPFEAASPYEVMRAHLERKPAPIRSLKPDTPAGLGQLIEQCLHKAPDQRPTAVELEALLERGAPLRRGRSRGMIVAMCATTLLLTGAGAWYGWQTYLRHDPGIATSMVRLLVDVPGARVRIDQGEWTLLGSGPRQLPPGTHQVMIEAERDGQPVRWSGAIACVSGETLDVPVQLTPEPTDESAPKNP